MSRAVTSASRRAPRSHRPPASEDTPCNLCGGRNEVVVGTRDRDGHPLRTVLCRTCGLVWTNPRPSAADMNAYYGQTYRADYKGQTVPPLRKIVRGLRGAADRRQLLRAYFSPPEARGAGRAEAARLLDVGCGAGELVYLMRREGIDASGIEPGIEFAAFARTVLRVPIQTATVDTAAVANESQDVVTMFHALEHVPDPRSVLMAVRDWIRRGGHLIVEVPNIAARVQAPSHQYHYAHLFHFTASTLAALGETAGLRVVTSSHSGDGGNVTCVFRRGEDDAPRMPGGLESEAARTLESLRGHTYVAHYLSPVPLTRAVGRLRRRLAEDRLLARIRSVEDALRWAESL